MPIPRRDCWRVVGFAGVFAAVMTGAWTAIFGTDYRVAGGDGLLWRFYYDLNFAGDFVTFLIQLFALGPDILAPVPPLAGHWVDWARLLVGVFVGALVQGLAYGLIGLVGLRLMRRRRNLQGARHER